MAEGVYFPIGSTRIHYVEPNYVTNAGNTLGVHGEHTNELIPPLEDYCIFVNLSVEVRGRSINISQDMNSKRYILNWESVQDKGSADFLQGTKFDEEVSYDRISRCSLTTRYTDTFIDDVDDGSNTEMFGISSIDIEYNNMMVPQVNISFIDVRGGSLFSSEEKAHNKVQDGVAGYNNPDIAGSFFKSFFTFPYPRFMLAVKGFYGQPVTYDLTCADWRATFDSSTGNFNVNAKFVGFQFSFLGDVMLNALTAAPCSDYLGSEYWKNGVQSGRFTVMNSKGDMVGMPTIAELLVKYNGAIKEAQSKTAAGETSEKANQLDSETKELNEVIGAYRNFLSALDGIFIENTNTVGISYKCSVQTNGYPSSIVYITEGYGTNKGLHDIYPKDKVDALYNAYNVLSGVCDSYNANNEKTNLSLVIKDPSTWRTVPLYKIDNSGKALFVYNSEQDVKQINGWANKNTSIANKAYNASSEEKKKNCMDNPKSLLNGFVFVDNGFAGNFSNLKERNARNVEENTKKQAEEEIKHLSDALGFTPSVENMTRIMMAHFETFVYMIRQTAINIESEESNRLPENLGIERENLIDLPSKARFVPPFPKVTEIATDASGNETQEETWIGDFDGDWLEEDLVNGLINGVKEVADSAKIYEAETTGTTETKQETVTTQMRYPLSPLDILIKGNPYGNSVDFNDISDVVGKVVIRAYQLLSLTSFGVEKACDNIESIAKIEAYNFSKLFKEVPSTFAVKVTDENNPLGNIANEIIYDSEGRNASIYGKNLGNGNFKYAWVNPKSPITYPLVKKGRYNASWFNGFVVSQNDLNDKKEQKDLRLTHVPVYSYSFESMFNNFSKFNVTEKGYPLYEKPKSITNIVTNAEICKDDNYSMVDVNAVFFDNSPKRYKNMLENNFTDDEQVFGDEFNKVKKLFKCFDYTDSNYEKLFDKKNEIYCPIEEEVEITEETKSPQVFPNTVRGIDKAKSDNLFAKGLCDVSEGYNEIKYFRDKNITVNPNENFWEDLDETNCRLHFFYGLDDDGDINKKVSLFGSTLYYTVEKNELKAILFLLSLKYHIDYKECFKLIFDKRDEQCVFVPQAAILLAGAILWACSNEKEFEKNKEFTKVLKKQIEELCVKKAGLIWNIAFPLTALFKSKVHMFNLRNEVRNMYVNTFLDWANSEFKTDIAANLEIPFKDKKEFFKGTESALDDIGFWTKVFTGGVGLLVDMLTPQENPEIYFLNTCNHSKLSTFFANYLTVDKDVEKSGILLAHRDSGVGVIKGTKVCLKMYAVVKGHKFQHVNEVKENTNSIPNVLLNSNHLKKYLKVFFDKLREIYKQNSEDSKSSSKTDRAKADTVSSKDIKIAIYRYCKLLYDKWIAGDTMKDKYTMEYFFDQRDSDKKGAFIFIDAFYKRIGQKMIVNIGDFMQRIVACQSQQQSTLLSFFSAVYAYNKFNFFCINNFLDLAEKENLVNMFRPIPYLDMEIPQNNPNFIVMFPYESSSHLDDSDGNADFPGDSFIIDANGDHLPKPLLYGKSDDYYVPAFGVSYGKMYQSYFTNIDVGMENPITTDQSIKAQFQIASMNNTNEGASDKKMITLGQDLFTVYSNNSYTCTIKMVGCAWVQPLMYFCLTNVPLFRGTYQIMNVTHQITPGNMVTTFKGVRMANSMSRRVKEWNVIGQSDGNGENTSSEAEYEQREYASANFDNDCNYKMFPLTENNGQSFADELSKTVTPDMVTVYENKLYTDRIIGLTVKNALARMVDVEAGVSSNELQKALLATTLYNRRSMTKWSTEVFNPKQMSCLKKSEMENEPSSDSLKIVEEIFTNGPLRFIGQITDVHKPVLEERQGITFKKGEKTHSTIINEIVLKKMYYFINPYTEMDLFKNSWVGPILCQHHAFGDKYEHAFCARSDRKDCWTNTNIHNDNSDENKFIKVFAKAVHDTCESSSSRCNIGFDPTKIKNNTFRFTCDDKTKLAVAFDVCLNTNYFGYVKKLLWIIADNGSGKEYPEFVRVQVSEHEERDKVIGIYYSGGSCVRVSDCNEDYIKCISKYLSNGGNKSYIKTMPSNDLLEKNKPQNCNELLNSSDGRHNYGEGGTLNGGMIGNWDAGKSAQYAIKHAFSSSHHVCAAYTMNAVRAGNVVEPRAAHADWLYYDHVLENHGWQIIDEGATVNDFNKTANPQLGDVCISTVYTRKSIQAKQKPPGEGGGYHACLFCGKEWVSDYKQSHAIPYTKSCKHWWLFRYSGKGMKLRK